MCGSGAHDKNLVRTYEKDDTGNPVATFVDVGPDHYAHSLVYAAIGLSLRGGIGVNQDITSGV